MLNWLFGQNKKFKIFLSNFPMWRFSRFSALFPSLGETLRNICSLINSNNWEDLHLKMVQWAKHYFPSFSVLCSRSISGILKLLSTQFKKMIQQWSATISSYCTQNYWRNKIKERDLVEFNSSATPVILSIIRVKTVWIMIPFIRPAFCNYCHSNLRSLLLGLSFSWGPCSYKTTVLTS